LASLNHSAIVDVVPEVRDPLVLGRVADERRATGLVDPNRLGAVYPSEIAHVRAVDRGRIAATDTIGVDPHPIDVCGSSLSPSWAFGPAINVLRLSINGMKSVLSKTPIAVSEFVGAPYEIIGTACQTVQMFTSSCRVASSSVAWFANTFTIADGLPCHWFSAGR
jgi:hypothetical protein